MEAKNKNNPQKPHRCYKTQYYGSKKDKKAN